MSATAHLPQIAKIASVARSVSYETITATPASPHIGAEIGNIDLTSRSNNQVEELHQAFIQYQVIFFRDQKISLTTRFAGAISVRSASMSASRPSARPPTILTFGSFITTRPQSRFPARIFTATSRARQSRRWAAFFIITRFRPTAAATPCLRACMRLTMRCRPA